MATMTAIHRWIPRVLCSLIIGLSATSLVSAGQLYVGSETISITPDAPVALDGQRQARIAKDVQTPCTATALAIETRDGDRSIDQAIFVACDLCIIRGGRTLYDDVRAQLKGRLPEEIQSKIILSATHTHTGPVPQEELYDLPKEGVMPPAEYRKFLTKRLADIIVAAWDKRESATVAWGLGHAVIAHNRRTTYDDGTTAMYGRTNVEKFRGMEGMEDHGVEILYFWNAQDKLIATAINVACPAQEVESLSSVNADFWHQVRTKLREKHGEDLNILGWGGAGGDQTTHIMYRRAAEERMRKLRGINALDDIANRIVNTWEDVLKVVKNDRHADVPFEHKLKVIQLPYRRVTDEEYASAKAALADLETNQKTAAYRYWNQLWHGSVVRRYEEQKTALQNWEMDLHAVRIGDISIVTNDFELYTDYGVQMKARSPSLQTFVIQLCGDGTYVPTKRAVAGGGYSAVIESSYVGPEGAQVLVNETVDLVTSMFQPDAKASK